MHQIFMKRLQKIFFNFGTKYILFKKNIFQNLRVDIWTEDL